MRRVPNAETQVNNPDDVKKEQLRYLFYEFWMPVIAEAGRCKKESLDRLERAIELTPGSLH